MRIAYFDCFAGASGDMIVGALVELGLPVQVLEDELAKIAIDGYEIAVKKVLKRHIGATKFTVVAAEQKVIRTFSNIHELIDKSALSDAVKRDVLAIFRRIAEAEAKIHRKSVDQIHFHEVGAIDSIVDVVASVVGLAHLGIDKVYASPLATGSGMVKTEHGMLPVPAPATLEILAGAPMYSGGITAELTTPTGAAILKHYATFVEDMPRIMLEKTGYGAGARDLDIPNVLRVMLGQEAAVAANEVILIETNIDDASPEVLGYTMQLLFELGALDVWFTPIEMKKSRPAVTLSALSPLGIEERLIEAIFSETATLGVRITRQARRVAERDVIGIDTPVGRIRVKMGTYKGKTISIAPEYDDCSKIAMSSGRPLKEVYDLAREAAIQYIKKG